MSEPVNTGRQSRYVVTLNGISMASLDSAIVVTDVNYEPPQYERETYSIAKRDGARIHRTYKDHASVSVSFMIREYSIADRQAICQNVISWARDGGDLRINDRPGRKLECICETFPAIESVRGWTDELTITFTAYAIPYWQDVEETVVTFSSSASNHVCEIAVPGNAPVAYLSVVGGLLIGTDNRVYIGNPENAEERMKIENIDLTNISGAVGGSIRIGYDENNIQTIQGTYTDLESQEEVFFNLMGKRTGLDDIVVKCGVTNYIYCGTQVYNAQTASYEYMNAGYTFRVRGLWE